MNVLLHVMTTNYAHSQRMSGRVWRRNFMRPGVEINLYSSLMMRAIGYEDSRELENFRLSNAKTQLVGDMKF